MRAEVSFAGLGNENSFDTRTAYGHLSELPNERTR